MMLLSFSSVLVVATLSITNVLSATMIDMGAASAYTLLAGTTITSSGALGTVVKGNIGVSPGSAIDGFPPAVLTGNMDSSNAAAGTAQTALTTAYNNAAAAASTATLSEVDLGGLTLLPGVYTFSSAASLNGVLTLDAGGDANAVWIFQMGTSLLFAGNSAVEFLGGVGSAENVFWQVGSSATLNGNSLLRGNVFALQSITVNYGAVVDGRLLARNGAVELNYNQVSTPASFDESDVPGSDSDDDMELSGGAIAGIVIGGVTAILLVVGIVVMLFTAIFAGGSAAAAPPTASAV